MSKKRSIALAPLFVIAVLALIPAAAQAAGPHWFKGGTLIKEGAKTPVVIFGGAVRLSGMDNIGGYNCKNVGGGTIENPIGGGPGIGTMNALGFIECQSNGCEEAGAETGYPLTIEAEWNDAPVEVALTGEGSSEHETIGEPFTSFSEYGKPVTKGEVQLRRGCETPPGYEPHVVGASSTSQGEISPKVGPGQNGTSATKPSTMTFAGASTGALHSELGGEMTFSGPIKYLGYNSQELITVE